MTKIVNYILEDVLSRRYPWHVRLGWRIIRYRDDIVCFFRKIYERRKYGFALEESWNFCHSCTSYILPRLKHLRKDLNFHPTGLTMKEWEDIMDSMIWSFEHIDDHIEPIYSEDYDRRYEVTEHEDGGRMYTPLNKTGTIDYTPVDQHNERIQEGLKLFAEYYRSLWD